MLSSEEITEYIREKGGKVSSIKLKNKFGEDIEGNLTEAVQKGLLVKIKTIYQVPQQKLIRINEYGQEIGPELKEFKPIAIEPLFTLNSTGKFCQIVPFDISKHGESLLRNFQKDDGRMWTYLSVVPFQNFDEFSKGMENIPKDIAKYCILMNNQPVGFATYLAINGKMGSVEVGYLMFSPLLQRTPCATEAMYLMMKHAFNLGFRRYEWKCDSLNARSSRAAERLGFKYEGTFRQIGVYKGRSRDSKYFSILDIEWPYLEKAFELWLDDSNFNPDGKQVKSLEECQLLVLESDE